MRRDDVMGRGDVRGTGGVDWETHFGGEGVERVSFDTVDGEGVVGVHVGESTRDWGRVRVSRRQEESNEVEWPTKPLLRFGTGTFKDFEHSRFE